ncbi:MAG: flagellar biosynthetic protein FliO [Eubacterium sp.]|nr:flagellar biosynthetic protein FliO [Eubacterium sp.]
MILSSASMTNSIIELITILLIFVFVLLITCYVTRWIAGYQKTKTAQGNLSVIEVIRVSNNQYIQLVRAGNEQYLVVGVSKDQMTLLATLSKEELCAIPEIVANTKRTGTGFAEVLEEFKKKHAK